MLIQRGHVLFQDKDDYCFVNADIRLENGYITEVGTNFIPCSGEETVDAKNHLVLPGLVNSHYHSYTNLLKGLSTGEVLELWSLGSVAAGGTLTAAEMKLSTLLGIAEMLHSGVTSCVDHIPHLTKIDTIAAAYKQAHFRTGIAPMIHNISDHLILPGLSRHLSSHILNSALPDYLSIKEYQTCYKEWIQKWHDPSGLTQIIVGPNAPQRADFELLEAAGELAAHHQLAVHTHLLESRWQAKIPEDLVEKLNHAGLLGARTSLAHSVWLNQTQIKLIRDSGAGIVCNPASNLFLGSGSCPIHDFHENGIRIAFGSDGSNCATNHNMIEIARLGTILHRICHPDASKWLPYQKAWQALTANGSYVTGWDGQIGTIKKGQIADLIIINMKEPAFYPTVNLSLQTLINLGKPDVRDVIIHGKLVMKNRTILTIDEPELYKEIEELTPRFKEKFQIAVSSVQELYDGYAKAIL